MAEENMGRRIKLWQIIFLVEFITIIFLGLYVGYERAVVASQAQYVVSVEKILASKDKREKELSAKLSSVMVLLQNAVNDLNQERQATAINNVVPPEAPVAK
ncbi:MAG: hypothetical protein NT079_04760 [Candidatus Omnitrophica bacterium]|nr:hypothetical protein [Candidatus Omnitrophota bacterium]